MAVAARLQALHLANSIETADFAPTTQQIAVHETFRRQIAELKGRLDQSFATDLPTFNAMLQEKSLPILVRKYSPHP